MTNQQCHWRSGKTVATNDDFDVNGDLFDKNFCHPPSTYYWNVTLPECINSMTKDTCGQSKNCLWSTGKELAPPSASFCAPEKLQLIKDEPDFQCGRNETDCAAPCKWFVFGNETSTVPMHCVSLDKTIVGSADNCQTIKDKAGCFNLQTTCEWIHKASTPAPIPEKVPLFSTDFCHPVVVTSTTLPSVWEGCI
jgi:hypothetical protein